MCKIFLFVWAVTTFFGAFLWRQSTVVEKKHILFELFAKRKSLKWHRIWILCAFGENVFDHSLPSMAHTHTHTARIDEIYSSIVINLLRWLEVAWSTHWICLIIYISVRYRWLSMWQLCNFPPASLSVCCLPSIHFNAVEIGWLKISSSVFFLLSHSVHWRHLTQTGN